MKKWILFIATICVILAAAIFGIVKKESYTNITGEENYLEQLYVAEIPEKLATNACSQMLTELPKVPFVLRVQSVGETEHLFGVSRQKVVVREVYEGNELEGGQEIYIWSRHWRLSLNGDYPSIERGFVNVMNDGSEYLIFATQEIDVPDEKIPIFELYDDSMITPMFCYEEKKNVIVETSGETTYVLYRQVKGNEFFGETEEALNAWKQLKTKMLALYPRDM